MTKIESIYNMWFKVWNVAYVPLIMDRQKWHIEGEILDKECKPEEVNPLYFVDPEEALKKVKKT